MSHWRATDSALTGYNKRYHTQPETRLQPESSLSMGRTHHCRREIHCYKYSERWHHKDEP